MHLAVLAKRDRRWVLSQLTVDERRVLKPHLREALKIGPEKLRDIIETVGSEPVADTSSENVSLSDLDDSIVPVLVQRLPQLVLALLAEKHVETWGKQYWAGLDELSRKTLPPMLRLANARVTPAFVDRLEASAIRIAGALPVSEKPRGFEGVLLNARPYEAPLDGSHG